MAPSLSAIFLALSIVSLASAAMDGGEPIDTQRSSIVIHVGKTGLLSAAGHEHSIKAPIGSGTVDSAGTMPSVRFLVDAAKLTVEADKDLSAKDQAKVQSKMQTEVLESSRYPKILFQSVRVELVANGTWKVDGNLTLHGTTRPVTAEVRGGKGAYVGEARIQQTDFGIQPIRVGGGVVTVKNELELRFKVYVQSGP